MNLRGSRCDIYVFYVYKSTQRDIASRGSILFRDAEHDFSS